MSEPASFEVRVRFYELDPYGHVNHATYLQYFEAARVAWLGEQDQGLDLLQSEGTNLVVTSLATRFVVPALLDDRLTIETGLVSAKRVTAQWAQIARRGDELVACQRINFATVNPAGRPIRIAEGLAAAMQRFALPAGWYARELPDLVS